MTDFEQIEIAIKNSPTLKMIRGGNAAFVISFLLSQFKETNEQPIPYNSFIQKLSDYLDNLNYQDSEDLSMDNFGLDSLEKAKKYIEQWSDEQHRYLSVYTDENSKNIMVVPTKYTSRVFQIIELLKERKFVGTESKFKDIFNKLHELIKDSIGDPRKKIDVLEKQKSEIESEIRRIRREQTVKPFENYQIKSRFDDITKLTNELIGDFGEVEDNFKIIVRSIIEKQSDNSLSKGKLLQLTFDSLKELKETDQGKSFYAFWDFLIDDARQDELKMLIDEVYNILDNREIEYNDRFLRRAKTILHSAGRKVWDSNILLSDKLTRIIAEKNLEERKKVKETINSIRQLALQMIDKKFTFDSYIEIDGNAKINLPMERKLVEEQIISEFNEQPKTAENILDLEALGNLTNLQYVNRKQLLNNVEALLNEEDAVTLNEILNKFPITKGLAEILGYISLLQTNSKYYINYDKTEYLQFDFNDNKYLKTPQIIFGK
jgi:hypothetical protein